MSGWAAFLAGFLCGAMGVIALFAGWAYLIWREDTQ